MTHWYVGHATKGSSFKVLSWEKNLSLCGPWHRHARWGCFHSHTHFDLLLPPGDPPPPSLSLMHTQFFLCVTTQTDTSACVWCVWVCVCVITLSLSLPSFPLSLSSVLFFSLSVPLFSLSHTHRPYMQRRTNNSRARAWLREWKTILWKWCPFVTPLPPPPTLEPTFITHTWVPRRMYVCVFGCVCVECVMSQVWMAHTHTHIHTHTHTHRRPYRTSMSHVKY